ncbi:CBS domain-containing protein [Natronospirillum operosum]|uniref:CBS domain-containing protein n=1 Tax=Natronospirillum operosum TaxID=2759953 RepID=A0A4Z0W9C9_9GAMM|nr:CBS domain-containing protein [Natronospirillum operosum]TGG90412.1 CBS domain-containing protein [Natronospirillum operosum]
MSVERLMSRPVVTVELDDDLQEVKRLFESSGFHHLVVVEKKRLVGVVSDRDLLRAISPYLGTAAESARDLATLNKRVHQIMTRKVHTVPLSATIHDVVEKLMAHRISCVPVVDDNHRPVGILTWRDILRELSRVRRAR